MKRGLSYDPSSHGTSSNKNVVTPSGKKARTTANSSTNTNEGHFKSNLHVGCIVRCRVLDGNKKTWVRGKVTGTDEMAISGDTQCNRKVCIEYEDNGGRLQVKYFWSKYKDMPPYSSIEDNVHVVDPVRELLEEKGGSKSYIYRAFQRFMPKVAKDEWKKALLNNNEGACGENFDFASLLDHISESASSLETWKQNALEKNEALQIWKEEALEKNESERSNEISLFLEIATLFEQLSDSETSNPFSLLQNKICKDDYAKNLINTATGCSDAHEDILYTITHVIGVFMAIELNHLDGK